MRTTAEEFDAVIALCKDVFVKKMQDYGPAWRIMRPESITDQLYIKANRVRSLEVKKESKVGEGIVPEFIAIVNYGIMGVVQARKGCADTVDMDKAEALSLYEACADEAKRLMLAKNHDYDEAWRHMRVSSYTDLILMKINRTKRIEDHDGKTLVSEGVDANYLDMVNYAVFALIKLALNDQ